MRKTDCQKNGILQLYERHKSLVDGVFLMSPKIGMLSLNDLKPSDLKGKTIFIRSDFNVPLVATKRGYRVADDTRIRRFLDLTFKKIHELTEGDCRIIIGSHLGRPHKKKDHLGWDGIFNIQFVSSHFDTLIRQLYGDTYTIFPPEIIDSHLKHSLEIVFHHRLPSGGIKFLPNLRYLLDPSYPDIYRQEFIKELAEVADVYINCAFGCSHRVTKSIKMLPQQMRKEQKIVAAGSLLYEEIHRLGRFGKKVIDNPGKTVVVAGGAKVSDKISILKEFVQTKVKAIFVGGKMVNAFLLARQQKSRIGSFGIQDIPFKILSKTEENNKNLVEEVKLANEIVELAEKNGVSMLFPEDYKVVENYSDTTFKIKESPDFEKELQLDLGPNTIEHFAKTLLQDNVENVFWNGPLGAYDHTGSDSYAEGSLELAKLLFGRTLLDENFQVVIGGGDSAAILNKISISQLKTLIKTQLEKHLPRTINRSLLSVEFLEQDSYKLWNYLTINFFVSTGGGASLEFLEHYIQDRAQSDLASYLPGTATLMELCML